MAFVPPYTFYFGNYGYITHSIPNQPDDCTVASGGGGGGGGYVNSQSGYANGQGGGGGGTKQQGGTTLIPVSNFSTSFWVGGAPGTDTVFAPSISPGQGSEGGNGPKAGGSPGGGSSGDVGTSRAASGAGAVGLLAAV